MDYICADKDRGYCAVKIIKHVKCIISAFVSAFRIKSDLIAVDR